MSLGCCYIIVIQDLGHVYGGGGGDGGGGGGHHCHLTKNQLHGRSESIPWGTFLISAECRKELGGGVGDSSRENTELQHCSTC